MSARDELATVIHDSLYPGAYREDRITWPHGIFVEADAILAAGYRKPEILGYLVVGKSNNSLDWDDQLYESEQACIDSRCGPYQDFTREPDSECYWGNDYKLCPVLSPEAAA